MHQNSPFCAQKSKHFLGRGTPPSPLAWWEGAWGGDTPSNCPQILDPHAPLDSLPHPQPHRLDPPLIRAWPWHLIGPKNYCVKAVPIFSRLKSNGQISTFLTSKTILNSMGKTHINVWTSATKNPVQQIPKFHFWSITQTIETEKGNGT